MLYAWSLTWLMVPDGQSPQRRQVRSLLRHLMTTLAACMHVFVCICVENVRAEGRRAFTCFTVLSVVLLNIVPEITVYRSKYRSFDVSCRMCFALHPLPSPPVFFVQIFMEGFNVLHTFRDRIDFVVCLSVPYPLVSRRNMEYTRKFRRSTLVLPKKCSTLFPNSFAAKRGRSPEGYVF